MISRSFAASRKFYPLILKLKLILCDAYAWLISYSDVLLQYYKFKGT